MSLKRNHLQRIFAIICAKGKYRKKGEDGMEKMKCLESMDFVKDWHTWRDTLHEAIAGARKFGVSDDVIKDLSVRMGEFLAEKVCPATKEEQLLKEMWDVATPGERKTIATLMFKLVG